MDLQVPDDVLVENVHLTDSLMTLLYKINEMYSEENDLHHLQNGLPVKHRQVEEDEKYKQKQRKWTKARALSIFFCADNARRNFLIFSKAYSLL